MSGPVGRRGRPAISHDNRRVRAFLRRFASDSRFDSVEDVRGDELPGWVSDALVGVAHLQTEGQKSTRPLSRRMLLLLLSRCDKLTTEDVAAALLRDYSRTAIHRYTAHARTASKAIEGLLQGRDENFPGSGSDSAHFQRSHARWELDAPFLEDARRAEALSMKRRPINLPL